jgi:hypothetical protein
VRLHPDTAREIAREQDRRNRPWRAAFVLLAIVDVEAMVFFARH